MEARMKATARAGFTLIEVLVTLVLVALLLGVVVPSVINQLDKGDPTRVISDLEGVRSGVKLFRIDVKRFPSSVEQLTEDPENPTTPGTYDQWTDNLALGGAEIAGGLLAGWNGPYLEGSDVTTDAGTLPTALGGEIVAPFVDSLSLGGVLYLAIKVTGLDEAGVSRINEEVDGTTVSVVPESSGRIQADSIGGDLNMYYLAVPVN